MNINNLYETKIEIMHIIAPNSNTTIDYNSMFYLPIDYAIVLKISLIDFNGNAVTNATGSNDKKVHVTCNKGQLSYFSINNGVNWLAISSANQKSVDIPVNTTGCFYLRYTANAWGLCTIGADTNKIQFMVKGFKDMSLAKTPNNTCTFQVDESIRACRLTYTMPAMSITAKQKTLENGIIPSKYIPFVSCNQISYRGDMGFRLTSTSGTSDADNVNFTAGSLLVRSGTTAGTNNDGNINTSSQPVFIEWRY